NGVAGVRLKRLAELSADLYVDCTGFRSLLLGKTLRETFQSLRRTLFCDRSVLGGWAQTNEPIQPYTLVQAMNAGWCWQIEHEARINRGYVYSSAFVNDAEAEE